MDVDKRSVTDNEVQRTHGRADGCVRARVLIPLALAHVALIALVVYVLEHQQQDYLQREADARQDDLKVFYHDEMEENERFMLTVLDGISKNRVLADMYRRGDREALIAEAKPELEAIRARHMISHFYFHDVEGRNFARVHTPGSFGDVIKRATLVEAKASGRPASGLEPGPIGAFVQRVVLPWRVDGQLIGYLELGVEFADTARELRERTNAQFAVAVRKDLLNRQSWEAALKKYGRSGSWDEFPSVVVMDRTADELGPEVRGFIEEDSAPAGQDGEHGRLVELADGSSALMFRRPIADTSGRAIGELVMWSDVTALVDAYDRGRLLALLVANGLALGVSAFFDFYLGRIQRKLRRRRAALEREVEERALAQAELARVRNGLEQAVAERTFELDQLFTASLDLLCLAGLDGYTRRANPAYQKLLGYSGEELTSRPFFDFVHPDDHPAVQASISLMSQGQPAMGLSLRLLRRDGQVCWTEWNVIPLKDGKLIYATGRDVTDRHNAEILLRQARDATATANAELRTEGRRARQRTDPA